MGSPISSTIAEIFLQHPEDAHVKQLLDSRNIAFDTRYVDDILITYDTEKTNYERITTYVNQIHEDTQINATRAANNSISFLDLLVVRKTATLEIDIYRKPTTTDTTINFPSNQPMEHKIAAYRRNVIIMNCLPVAPHRKQKEWDTIQRTAQTMTFLKHSHND